MTINKKESSKNNKLWLIIISVFLIHLICYKATATLNKSNKLSNSYSNSILNKRTLNFNSIKTTNLIETTITTTTINSTLPIIKHEEINESNSLINYRNYYELTSNKFKPLIFISLVLWLIFLFAFVGITAADFFCPNLSTIASRLGMSESVAGVTFLAFSNGSPDVFSTFAALRTNSGALAIGELLGAASFIVSVVAGTMCVIQPFRVSKHSFLRDVGFFTIAVLFTLGILYDNHIHAWEAVAMVILYFVYVGVVGAQSWWLSRKAKRDALIRAARDEYAVENNAVEYYDDPLSTNTRNTSTKSRSQSNTDTRPSSSFFPITPIQNNTTSRPSHSHHFLSQDTFQSLTDRSATTNVTLTRTPTLSNPTPQQQQQQSSSLSSPTITTRIAKTRSTVRPSLLGAIEFRDVVNSLRADSTARTLAIFGGGIENNLIGAAGDIHASFIGTEDEIVSGSARGEGGGGGGKRPSGRLSRSTSISSSGILPNSTTSYNSNNSGFLIGSVGGVESNSTFNGRPKHSRKVSWSPGMTLGKPDENEEESSRGFWEEPLENQFDNGGGGGEEREGSESGSRSSSRVSSRRSSLANTNINPFGGIGNGFTSDNSNSNSNSNSNPWQASMDRRPLRLDLSNLPSPSSLSDSTSGTTRLVRSPAGGTISLTPTSSNQPPHKTLRKVPSILLTTAAGDQTTVLAARTTSTSSYSSYSISSFQPWKEKLINQKSYKITRAVFLALFPSLQDFKSKSYLGKATALLCVPAILVLNLTLPVVDPDEDECHSILEKDGDGDDDDDDSSSSLNGGREDFDSPGVEGEDEEDNLIDLSERSNKNATPNITNNDFFSFKPQTRRNHHQQHNHQRNSNPQSPNEETNSPTESEAKANRESISRQFHSRVIAHPEHQQERDIEEDSNTIWSGPEVGIEVQSFSIANNDDSANKIPPSRGASMTSFEGDSSRDHREESDGLEALSNGALTRWLTAVQCTLAPVFCVTALFAYDLEWWYPLVALLAGLLLAITTFHLFEDPKHPGRIILCFVGFFVAMVWILTIVGEVVGVLQTFGHIFGLSDAILGLTIFAMGNSLGDLVANATVARMGFPSMAIAACFGGPMLNILLGIGLSGSYVIFKNGGEPYEIVIGPTLLVSGGGLLLILVATLIIVPLNDYIMNKQIGIALMTAYAVVLSATVAVEVWL